MKVGILKETFPGERRVALVPAHAADLIKAGAEVLVESGAGLAAGHDDEEYRQKGATVAESRAEILSSADAILAVRAAAADPEAGLELAGSIKPGAALVGLADPWGPHEAFRRLASRKASLFALELLPRITRAQPMDVLSSQANLAGYKAVLLAADTLPRLFPMMMTAAGTIVPAKLLVIGVGVAGLQALATARRLGAVTSAYDVRTAVREQVQSLGAKFIELPLEAAEGAGGYAKAMDEEFYRKQRELLAAVIKDSDVLITTAAVPGKKAPVLVSEAMVRGMPRGSVVVDLAAERGGNCEPTRPGRSVEVGGVTVLGPVTLAAGVPGHASRLYSKNISTFFLSMVKEGRLVFDEKDEIVSSTMVMRGGEYLADAIRPKS